MSEQLANSVPASLSTRSSLCGLGPLEPLPALLLSRLEQVELGAFPDVRAHQGLRCLVVRLSASVGFRSLWTPTQSSHPPSLLAPPDAGQTHVGQSAELQPGPGAVLLLACQAPPEGRAGRPCDLCLHGSTEGVYK